MGGACCIAVRDKTISDCPSHDIVHRNVRHSPSWSFRWDNRGRVAGEVETPLSPISNEIGLDRDSEIKSTTHEDSTYLSGVGSPLESLRTPISQKSPVSEDAAGKLVISSSDQSFSRNVSFEVQESPEECTVPSTKHSVSVSPLSSKSHRIQALKPQSHPVSKGGRPSSDNWSMQVFSELVVSSRRDRWSFDSEEHDKISRSSSGTELCSRPSLIQTCGVCSKVLTEKSPWSSVVAVLFCGHVYHAECLESMTLEINKYDPACPLCTNQTLNLCEKGLKSEMECKAKGAKRWRHRIVDNDDVEVGNDSMKWDPSIGKRSFSLKDSCGKSRENQRRMKKSFLWTRSSKK